VPFKRSTYERCGAGISRNSQLLTPGTASCGERAPKSGLPDFGNLTVSKSAQPISMRASRRMDARYELAAILRDGRPQEGRPPQDEVQVVSRPPQWPSADLSVWSCFQTGAAPCRGSCRYRHPPMFPRYPDGLGDRGGIDSATGTALFGTVNPAGPISANAAHDDFVVFAIAVDG